MSPRAECPVCEDSILLRLDGTFRRHNRQWGYGFWWCPGSETLPENGKQTWKAYLVAVDAWEAAHPGDAS